MLGSSIKKYDTRDVLRLKYDSIYHLEPVMWEEIVL